MSSSSVGSFEWVPMFSGPRLMRYLKAETITEMARIPSMDLNCAFYLYPDEHSARTGMTVGGSGFWVAVSSENVEGLHWFYAVSNRHVVHSGGASIIRANMKGGGTDTIVTDPTEWTEHPAGHDIAILPIDLAIAGPIDLSAIPAAYFVTEIGFGAGLVGVGDDVYLIGRFINHEGRARNTPSARFGNISMLPGEPIYIDEKSRPQESFVVELRSMCGYSGSPVFLRTDGWDKRGDAWKFPSPDLLLGVHWGHLVENWNLETRIVFNTAGYSGLRPGEREVDFVSANTGMNGVVPAWRLSELLNLPLFKQARENEEAAIIERMRRSTPGAKLDSAS